MSNDARNEKEETMRRRVARFLGDPAAIEEMTGEEIRAAVRLAFNAVKAWIGKNVTN